MAQLEIIIPVYRNRECLEELLQRLTRVLNPLVKDYRIVLVNDACPDGSGEELARLAHGGFQARVLNSAKNRGQHRVLMETLRRSNSDYCLLMDGDLQDEPEVIPRLWEKRIQDLGIVFAARRGAYESPLRLWSSRLFKGLLRLWTGIPDNVGTFLLMDRRAREKICQTASGNLFFPALVGCWGIPFRSVEFERPPRRQGRSSYNTRRRIKTALQILLAVLIVKANLRLRGSLRKDELHASRP